MTMAARKSRDSISCPRQRILARFIGPICDLFSDRFMSLPPGERFLLATRDDARVWSYTRMFAIGAVHALGKDMGLPAHAMHGRSPTKGRAAARGRTEIEELRPLHYGTLFDALEAFEALRKDGSEFGRLVSERYALIRRDALEACAMLENSG
jgi:hypothetical protein